MMRARNKKGFRNRSSKMAFRSKALVFGLRWTGRRRKVKCRHLGRRDRANYLGLTIGLGTGLALFAILFLTAPKSGNGHSDEEHGSGEVTNTAGSGSQIIHE